MQPEIILAINVGANVVTVLAVVGFIFSLKNDIMHLTDRVARLEGYVMRESKEKQV